MAKNNFDYKKITKILGNDFDNKPIYVSLADDSPYRKIFDDITQKQWQKELEKIHKQSNVKWSYSEYLENRESGLIKYPQMAASKRFFHLGIDINAPVYTKLYAPHDSEVVISTFESGIGNYGGLCVLKSKTEIKKENINKKDEYIYILFGHLDNDNLPNIYTKLKKGDYFARFGDFHQNGNWFYHVHIQILTQKAFDNGWINKGYCSKKEIECLDQYCPNPMLYL
ncbi:MAG: hypothetical protein FWF57_08755 [Defluviitaleaceae bacterium]|nr:hypothetical protein [Defluviitaleaceae bacterium]